MDSFQLFLLGKGGEVEVLLGYYLDDLLQLKEQHTEDVTQWHKDMNFIFEWQNLVFNMITQRNKIRIFKPLCEKFSFYL